MRAMAVSSPALDRALGDIVGREHLLSDAAALEVHAVDGVRPRWVARPSAVEQISRALALASAEGLAVAPRGSGSSLSLGNAPGRLDLVLDLGRMQRIIEYVPEDMVGTAEAGLSLGALGAQLAARGQMLALDPIGGASRSVGGVLACHASGPLRVRYGTGRDLLLGVRFVQADGTVTWGGSRVVKSVSGYDVPKLLVGSLGTLGVIAEATVRLHPVPPARGSWLVSTPSHEIAADCLVALLASTLEPDRLAVLNAEASKLVGVDGAGAALLISFGSVAEAVASQGAALERLAKEHRAGATAVAAESWEQLAPALSGPVKLKLACEPRRLLHWLAELEREAAGLRLTVSAVGQGGHGVLESSLTGPLSARRLATRLLVPLRQELGREGGSLVVERAPAELKSELEPWGPISPELFAIHGRVKQAFDPNGVLNPGRFAGGL